MPTGGFLKVRRSHSVGPLANPHASEFAVLIDAFVAMRAIRALQEEFVLGDRLEREATIVDAVVDELEQVVLQIQSDEDDQ
jgi:hypothetical protein